MSSKLCVYAAPTHSRAWLTYVTDLQPYDILILSPDIQEVSDAYVAAPNAEITLRRWDWDDNRTEPNPDGVYRWLRDDPEGLARWQIDQYVALVTEWESEAKRRGIPFPPREQLVLHPTNEPDTNTLMPQINRTTVAAARYAHNFGFKIDGLNLSTGHPAILRDGVPDWTPLQEALDVLAETGSYAVVHEYRNDLPITDPSVYPWHIGRASKWAPRGPRYKVGEYGLEMLLNGRMDDHHGWQGIIPPEQMVADTDWYLGELRDDFVGARIYMTDYEDRKWQTFDTEPIHAELVTVGQRHPSQPIGGTVTPPFTVHLPEVGTGTPTEPTYPATATVDAPAGANIRSGPGLEFPILSAEPYGDTLAVIGRNAAGDWWQVGLPHREPSGRGWVYGEIIKTHNLADVPVVEVEAPPPPNPPSEEDKWARCRAFVKRWEGDFQDFDWDAGNWTGCKVGEGEKKGTNRGISACAYPHLDIRNLTEAQADEIFYQDYYLRSGADKQPWPMCLLVYNAAVNFHPTTAQKWLMESRGNALRFVALYLRGYRYSDAWPHAHDAWVDRVIDVAMEASG